MERLTILVEDDDLLALSKPAGLSAQAPPIAGDSLERRVREYLQGAGGTAPYLGCVHRIDRPVSGVVLWAKSVRAARLLAKQFERRQVKKTYWAVVEGVLSAPNGLWEDWLVREDTGLGQVQVCRAGTPRAQRAVTRFSVRSSWSDPIARSFLELHPETGRMHQLRIQCAHRGHPILGDAKYGAQQPFVADAIALHARALTFRHPGTGQIQTIEANLPPHWSVLEGVGIARS